jgi:hypothetical protein
MDSEGCLRQINKSVEAMQKAMKNLTKNATQISLNHVVNEGNKGGDFINIKNVEEGSVYLKVGNCCVCTIDSVVPVEFLSMLLTREVLEYGSIEGVIDSFTWPDKFKEELKSKVKVI